MTHFITCLVIERLAGTKGQPMWLSRIRRAHFAAVAGLDCRAIMLWPASVSARLLGTAAIDDGHDTQGHDLNTDDRHSAPELDIFSTRIENAELQMATKARRDLETDRSENSVLCETRDGADAADIVLRKFNQFLCADLDRAIAFKRKPLPTTDIDFADSSSQRIIE